MIELSGQIADGAHPFFVTPQITVKARSLLGPEKRLVGGRPVSRCGTETGQWPGATKQPVCCRWTDFWAAVWRRSRAGRI
jgi:hypothetical protein